MKWGTFGQLGISPNQDIIDIKRRQKIMMIAVAIEGAIVAALSFVVVCQ